MFDTKIYSERRKKLSQKINSGLILILGHNDTPSNYAGNPYHFRQNSSFLYFFGIDLQGLAGVIDVESGEEYLFGNDVDIDDIIWMGPQEPISEKAKKAGCANSAPFNKIEELLLDAISKGRKIHYLPQERAENQILIEKLLGIKTSLVSKYVSVELIKAVISLRNIKEDCEIAEMDTACNTGYLMQTTAMKLAQPGVWEQHIAGTIEGISLANGGMTSFPTILSRRGETLHNHDHSNILQKNDLLLVDCGAETPMKYASDFTRTMPVGGEFTQKQKEIYLNVLNANNLATSMVKPGIKYLEVHKAVCKLIAGGLKDLGFIKGNIDDAVAAGAHSLFMPHGLGHMIGMDVHDMEDLGEDYVGYGDGTPRVEPYSPLRCGRTLEVGHVISNEPGTYFIPALIDQWQSEGTCKEFINFDKVNQYRDFGGIRLEDDVLVTPEGHRLLGDKRIPITPEEIADVMKG